MQAPLIHIGYNKTGSSWLQQEFFPMRELGFEALLHIKDKKIIYRYIVKEHELYYKPEKILAYLHKRLEKRTNLLPVLSAERFSGDPHSGGYDSTQIARRLHQLFPKARILIVVRKQSDMLLSTYTQYIRAGGTRSLKRYLAPPKRGSRRVPQFDFRYFDYAPLVAYYQKLFGTDRVKVLPYEWLRLKPEHFLSEILHFAELATPKRLKQLAHLPFGKRINKGYGPFTLNAKRLYNRFFLDNALHPAAPFPLPEGVERRAVLLFQTIDALLPAFISRADKAIKRRFLQKKIAGCYERGNTQLSQITNLNLKALGYP